MFTFNNLISKSLQRISLLKLKILNDNKYIIFFKIIN